jgi:hypothetical protein
MNIKKSKRLMMKLKLKLKWSNRLLIPSTNQRRRIQEVVSLKTKK